MSAVYIYRGTYKLSQNERTVRKVTSLRLLKKTFESSYWTPRDRSTPTLDLHGKTRQLNYPRFTFVVEIQKFNRTSHTHSGLCSFRAPGLWFRLDPIIDLTALVVMPLPDHPFTNWIGVILD